MASLTRATVLDHRAGGELGPEVGPAATATHLEPGAVLGGIRPISEVDHREWLASSRRLDPARSQPQTKRHDHPGRPSEARAAGWRTRGATGDNPAMPSEGGREGEASAWGCWRPSERDGFLVEAWQDAPHIDPRPAVRREGPHRAAATAQATLSTTRSSHESFLDASKRGHSDDYPGLSEESERCHETHEYETKSLTADTRRRAWEERKGLRRLLNPDARRSIERKIMIQTVCANSSLSRSRCRAARSTDRYGANASLLEKPARASPPPGATTSRRKRRGDGQDKGGGEQVLTCRAPSES